ncbi:hypothetical protein FC99_GL001816 [Levilactobacillus koreensis JCM 16448]|uniref:O-antigen ligase-related domain-containing protein n=1 Tax=Levilactobacillus koreensis TaxID=637971 RepID=A0AAC8UXJ0_9LACO|nr:O-antigen ligase family protein [Levilactobacillus koreensis]AKP65344.1 hypothetical protein ABN16_10240 [Levilactobacillus koreensis]KRK86069.1 hypothetical protein FC99_GL001816 [Levilactobacillus koreensis JCM 16448]
MIKIKTEGFLAYPLIIALILSMNTVYYKDYTSPNVAKFIVGAVLLFSIGLSVISVLDMKQKKISIQPLLLFILKYLGLTGVLFLVNLLKGGIGLYNVTLILLFPLFISPFLYHEKVKKSFYVLTIYKKVVLFLSVMSLFFWILSLMNVSPNMTKVVFWGPVHQVSGYYNLQFIPQGSVQFLWFTIVRNCGIFVEAPMFAFVLSLALLFHLFIEPDAKILGIQTILLSVTIISTTSTTGVVVMILAILLVISRRVNGVGRFALLFLFPVVMLIIFVVVQSKVQNMAGSVDTRIDDIIAGVSAWKSNPIFGNGLKNIGAISNYMDPSRVLSGGNSGFSSGFFQILALGGVFYTLFWLVIPLFNFARKSVNYRNFSILFFLLILVSLVNDTLLYYFVIILMMVTTI